MCENAEAHTVEFVNNFQHFFKYKLLQKKRGKSTAATAAKTNLVVEKSVERNIQPHQRRVSCLLWRCNLLFWKSVDNDCGRTIAQARWSNCCCCWPYYCGGLRVRGAAISITTACCRAAAKTAEYLAKKTCE